MVSSVIDETAFEQTTEGIYPIVYWLFFFKYKLGRVADTKLLYFTLSNYIDTTI